MRWLVPVLVVELMAASAGRTQTTISNPGPYSLIVPISLKTGQPGTPIQAASAGSFVLSADGSTFYAAQPGVYNTNNGQVLAIDRLTGKVLHTYTTKYPIFPNCPVEVDGGGASCPVAATLAVLPDQSELYVGACSLSNLEEGCLVGQVEILDVATGKSLGVLAMDGNQIGQIVTSPNGATVYVAHWVNAAPISGLLDLPCDSCGVSRGSTGASGALTAIDVATRRVSANFNPSGTGGFAFAVSPSGGLGYLLATYEMLGQGGDGAAMYVIDLADMVASTTTNDYGTCGFGALALSPNGKLLAAVSQCLDHCCSTNGLTFVDTTTGKVFRGIANFGG
jgi:DNA-binding beta-propeller fold protein YncE